MAELKIPQKTLQDNFNLQDFKDDFNALNSEIEENKTFTDSEISKLKEIANTWETFKNTGGTIGGNIAVNGYVKSKENFYSTGTNDVGLMSDTSGVKYSSGSKILYPTLTDQITLGNSSLRWKDIYLNGMNKNANGYNKLPNGMLLQWGIVAVESGIITEVTLPMTFPNGIIGSWASIRDTPGSGECGVASVEKNTSTIVITHRNGFTRNIRYFAIGY